MTHKKGQPPNRQGKQWTGEEVQKLRNMAPKMPTGLIADTLGRTEEGIRAKAGDEHISLKPVNRSPDKRRKK
ncbi:MAG: hypothetical protein ACRDH9_03550 [Actinomycetota bacterium]